MSAEPTPEATVAAWADAWRRLDPAAVLELFTDDATYVAALSGEIGDLRRSFSAATRTWGECRIEDLSTSGENESVVRATYRFAGTTRRGNQVEYAADATFRLEQQAPPDGRWRITAFHESFRPGTVPTIGGRPLGTVRP